MYEFDFVEYGGNITMYCIGAISTCKQSDVFQSKTYAINYKVNAELILILKTKTVQLEISKIVTSLCNLENYSIF
jgi:hypothetical protein